MRKLLLILGLLCLYATSAHAQVTFGGPQAPLLPVDQQGTNVAPHGGTFTGCASFTACGWATNPTCAVIDSSTNPPGETTGSAKLTNCGPNNISTLEVSNLAPSGADALGIWVKVKTDGTWQGMGLTASMFDNQHGSGAGPSGCCSRMNSPIAKIAGSADSVVGANQGFQTYYFEMYLPFEHLFDTNLQLRFNVGSYAAWTVKNTGATGYTLGTIIQDSNNNLEEVTDCSGSCYSGASAPAWDATVGDTTVDNQVTWTNKNGEGSIWLADVIIAPVWRAMRSMLLYPNYRGYLNPSVVPPARFTQIQPVSASSPFYNFFGTGSVPVAGEIEGVSEIIPPSGDTLSQLTLVVKMATVAGCGSGVLATDSIASPLAEQPWQFTPTQYGSLTLNTKYYTCSSLYVTSGMALIDSDVDWGVVPENGTFFAGLYNWFGQTGMWYQNQVQRILHGSYDRYDSARGIGLPASLSQAIYNYAGNSPSGDNSVAPQATGSPAPTHDSLAYDYVHQGLNDIIDFAQWSADTVAELGYRLNLFANAGLVDEQDWSLFFGCLTTGTTTCTAPTFTPTIVIGSTATGITANYLFLEWVSAAGGAPVGNSPPSGYSTTLPSSPVTVHLTGSSGCSSGTNCTASFTAPSCTLSPTFQVGGLLYAAIGSTSTPPANSAFSRQFPVVTPVQFAGAGDVIPCGATVELATFDPNTVAPPTTDTTSGGQPNWRGSESDSTLYAAFTGLMCSNSYPQATGGFYIGDEYSYTSIPVTFYMTQILNADCPGTPTTGLDIGDDFYHLTCRIFDRCGSDPYGSLNAAGPDEYITGELLPRDRTNFYNTNNAPATNTSYPSRTDLYADAECRGMYGSRPSWTVVRQYGITNVYGFGYAEMEQNLWKALIGCWKYGDAGAGVMTWGQVGSTGLEATVYTHGDSQAYYDTTKASNEVKALDPVSLTPILDTSVLSSSTGAVDGSTGRQLTNPQVISNVKITAFGGGATTVATQCNDNGVSYPSMYSNATNWPYGPAEFVTHNYTPATTNLVRGYIYYTNVCDSSMQVTFSFPSVPAATVAQVIIQAYTPWAPSTAVTDSLMFVDSNGNLEQVTTPGTTAASAPAWNGTPGGTTTDGTAAETNYGPMQKTIAISTSGCPNSQPACFTAIVQSMGAYVFEVAQPGGSSISGGPNVP